MIAIVSPLDHPDAPTAPGVVTDGARRLRDLARWTGGSVSFVSIPAQASAAASRLLTELRHQYVLAFAAAGTPGWRRIEIRVSNLYVRARSAYAAQ